MRDVIVLLPGILGSVLARDGEEVWAPSKGAAGRALWSLGRSITSLRLDDDPWEQDDLGDGVTATRLVPDLHLLPGVWGIDGYTGIRDMIAQLFDVVPGVTYNELPYDWRRDNRVAARRLKALAAEKLRQVRRENSDAKLVLIAHSMGGLVARYYLECLDGWQDTRLLITFGTPYRGSLNALDFIANGFPKKVGPLRLVDLTDLLRSLTSVYQLLPTYPCVDLGQGYQRVAELPPGAVPHLDLPRATSALVDFHHAIADAVAARPEARPYAIHTVVGITQGTKQSARLDGGRVVVEQAYDGRDRGGDGTVPRVSATPVETDGWADFRSMYANARHSSLQNAVAVQVQLLGILTQPDFSAFRVVQPVRLDVDQVFAVGEPVDLSAVPSVPGLTLAATVVDIASGREVASSLRMQRDADDVYHLSIGGLEPGDFRVSVTGVGDSVGLADPVHEVFSVVPDVEPDTG